MQTFNVTGMTCAHCQRAVTQAIQSRDANAKVDVDLQAGVVRVEGGLDEATIREAIEEEGYQVQ
ncbi:heavy-metal-associated domain-containing protein [Stutzerimonas stutzeri]|uniref:heavy-metal-associated domain-containing protein n=1 Tax=Stutzerimonas stutzeri TaxID=316 RepID=UPI00210D8174|nr:cation transporter [Stutzerimonas stutzeri]MCQ4320900.1 cation transporter [Stutzerimonas stutzeri]